MLVRKDKFLACRDLYYEMVRKVSYFFATLEVPGGPRSKRSTSCTT